MSGFFSKPFANIIKFIYFNNYTQFKRIDFLKLINWIFMFFCCLNLKSTYTVIIINCI